MARPHRARAVPRGDDPRIRPHGEGGHPAAGLRDHPQGARDGAGAGRWRKRQLQTAQQRERDAGEDAEHGGERDPLVAETLPELPRRDAAKLYLQSPNRIFVYWTFAGNPYATLQKALGRRADAYQLVSRLVNLDTFNESFAPAERAGNWWFNVRSASRYRVDFGFYAANRPFIRLLSSNSINTPRAQAQAVEADEAGRVALLVDVVLAERHEPLVVERERAGAAHHARRALIEPERHVAAHAPLRHLDERVHRLALGRPPPPLVHEVGVARREHVLGRERAPVEHESGKGFGSTEAARGALSDWIVIENGKIKNYVFIHMRLKPSPAADITKLRAAEPYYRDSLIRAAHRTSFADGPQLPAEVRRAWFDA